MGRGAALQADLHHPVVLAGGGEHRLALDDVDADGLLAVDVGSGLAGRDHGQGMPVIGRGDQDEVKFLAGEHLPVVGIRAGLLARLLAGRGHPGGFPQRPAVDVAQRNDVDRLHLDEAEEIDLAIPARADDADLAGALRGARTRHQE